jgi:hypothetical protein
VILTTNFDWLIEDAIHKEREKPPTLVASPSEIRGMSPLNTQECLVIHLHGHHLNPTGMLNTAEELNAYPSEVEDLLDEIFPKYGLIIAGWSAIWDNALRTAIDRNPNRHYATYWVDPFPLSKDAQALCDRRMATYERESNYPDTHLSPVWTTCACRWPRSTVPSTSSPIRPPCARRHPT